MRLDTLAFPYYQINKAMLQLSGQNCQKNSLKVVFIVFVNSALKLQCHIVKNTLLLLAILPTGRIITIMMLLYINKSII